MKNYYYWKSFTKTGKIDDYLHYIACTRDEGVDEPAQSVDVSRPRMNDSTQGINSISSGLNITTQGFE